MASEWQYQLRFDLGDPRLSEALRHQRPEPVLAPLTAILAKHRATAKCQHDAFAEYVAAAEAEGIEKFPLYAWTKATIEDPAKQAKYTRSFTLYVDGHEVYEKASADALELELRPLAASGLITRLMKYDTNPANSPQPPKAAAKA